MVLNLFEKRKELRGVVTPVFLSDQRQSERIRILSISGPLLLTASCVIPRHVVNQTMFYYMSQSFSATWSLVLTPVFNGASRFHWSATNISRSTNSLKTEKFALVLSLNSIVYTNSRSSVLFNSPALFYKIISTKQRQSVTTQLQYQARMTRKL